MTVAEKVAEQRAAARRVVSLLEDFEVPAVDLLDALASAGLRLERDLIGYAHEAYTCELAGDA